MTTTAPSAAQRRREQRAWYVYDWANSAFATSVLTVFLGPYLTDIAEEAAGPDGSVRVLGMSVPDGSLYSYTIATSVVLSALLMPVVAAMADRTGRNRELLGFFAYLGAAATLAMYFVEGERYLLGAGLLLLANVAFSVSGVVYNAYLPRIADADSRDDVSARGWAAGYLGGLVLLLVNLGLFLGHERFGVSEGQAVRISLASAGVWWGVFTLVPLLGLGRLQTPAVPAAGQSVSSARQLLETVRDIRRHPRTLGFLIAFLLYNEGIQTVASHASLYGAKELDLSSTTLITAIVIVQIVGVAGALGAGRAARRFGAKRTVLAGLAVWMAAVGAAYALPAGEPAPFYALAVVIGFVLGGVPALSRSMFAQMIPAGREAQYFCLFALTNKGTSALGPVVFGLAYQLTGSYRVSIVVILVFFIAGFLALLRVRVADAIRAAGNTVPKRV